MSNMFGDMSKSAMIKDMVEEIVDTIGFQIKYLPRKYSQIDPVFGEDPASYFDTVWMMNAIIDAYQDFGDIGDFYSKFGVQVTDEMKLSICKDAFAEQTVDVTDDKPVAGDLIYFTDAGALFEVSFVGNDSSFYPNPEGPQHVWSLTMKPWEYGHENIDVSDAEITAEQVEIQAEVDKELGLPDWDIEDDDVINFDEINPFGSIK